jgi:hypothetical protein
LITETVPSNLVAKPQSRLRIQTDPALAGIQAFRHSAGLPLLLAKRLAIGFELWAPCKFGPCLSHPAGFIHLLNLADLPDWILRLAVAHKLCSFPRRSHGSLE